MQLTTCPRIALGILWGSGRQGTLGAIRFAGIWIYRLDDRIYHVIAKYYTDGFWDNIQKLIQGSGSEGLLELKRRIVTLKKRGIEIDKCKGVLTKIAGMLESS
jgi:hypothetical protein